MDSLMLSQSLQDYLEVILNLSKEENSVRITDIAKKLNIAKASATQAINTLKDMGLAVQEKYGPVTLTERGKEEAAKVWFKHQVLYDFLTTVLKVEPTVAEKDACLIEHIVSPQTMEHLVEFLNTYKDTDFKLSEYDKITEEKEISLLAEQAKNINTLDQLAPGSRARVIRVTAVGSLRRRLLEMGIIPGVEIKIERVAPLGDPVEINVKGYYLSLRKEEASCIIVEMLGD